MQGEPENKSNTEESKAQEQTEREISRDEDPLLKCLKILTVDISAFSC